jgi:hypothetical protein
MMLWTLTIVLLTAWVTTVAAGIPGVWIHALLVLAVLSMVANFARSRPNP